MKRIVLTAYDINPYRGSESATGWNFSMQAARFNKVIAITRENNRENIEKYIEEYRVETSNIEFLYFDLPYYLRFWKKGARGSAIYFYLWQLCLPIFIRNRKINFDIAHSVNFHTDSFPTFLWVLKKPTVWGPINHNEKIPKQYILSKKEYVKDRLKWIIKKINWKLDPFLYLSKKKCTIIIGGNSSVQKRLKIPDYKFIKLTQVAANSSKGGKILNENNSFNFLVVGRFLAIKSFDIAIKSFDKFYNGLKECEKNNVKLDIIGEGNINLKKRCNNLNSKKSIEFHGWVDKKNIDYFYQNSKVFVFPSHEGAGMVIVEALSNGLPIICFNNFGPGEFLNNNGAIKIEYSSYKDSIEAYANAMTILFKNNQLREKMSICSLNLFEEKYTWRSKGVIINEIYNDVLKKVQGR